MIKFALTTLGFLTLMGCTTAQVQQVDNYAAQVTSACTLATSLLGTASVAVPAVASAATLVTASCGTVEAVNSLILSPTSVAWLNTLVTTIKSNGQTVPPAPIVYTE